MICAIAVAVHPVGAFVPSMAGHRSLYGEYSYTWSGQTLSFDYASTTFDYSKMLDYYNSTATTEQKTAVAQLMYGCGVTAQMNYALSGSGASLNNAGVGMMRNFDYAASMNRIFRDHYEINDWLNILYDELSNQRPILYAGYTESGGHAFVLDGFKADGNYFHVNWGWGGDSDGYYVITALNPGSQGIGGSSSGDGFNYSQEALIGIEKNYDGAESGYYCYVGGDFVVDKTEYTRSETVRFLEVSGGYLGNGGLSTIKMAYGVKLTNSDTGEVTYLHGNEVEMPSGYGWARYWFNASEFPSTGNYIVEPSALVNGEYGIVHTDIFSVRALKMTATESKLIFSAIEEDSGLTATNLQVLSTPYVGANLELSVDITNEGIEYYDNVYPILMVGDSIAAEFDGERIDLPRGSSTTLKLAYTIPTTITAGDYTLYMCDANGRKISSPVSVTISEAPDGTASLAITGFTCPGSYGGSGTTQLDPALIDATNFKLDVDVTNSGTGIYRNVVYAFVYNLSGGGSLAYIGYGLYQINPGESKTMSFSNDISSGLTIGTTYFVALFYYPDSDGAFFNNYFFIQPIDTTAGIETVDSDNDGNSVNVSVSGSEIGITSQADIEQVRIYNTTGKLVRSEQLRTSATDVSINAEGLTHGIYLVQVQTSTGITTVKVTI